MTAADAGHLSEMSLDLLLLGDLSGAESRRARGHLRACAQCAGRFDVLVAAAKHFESNIRPRTEARVLGAPAAPAQRRKGRIWWVPALAAAALGVAVLVMRGPARTDDGPSDDGIGVKGAPVLTVFLRHAGRVSMLGRNAHVEPGDAVRFTADPNGYRYLFVASIDAARHVTVYVSNGGLASAAISPHQRFEDTASFILDETRGPERLFALFSRRAIDAAGVRRALERIGATGQQGIRGTPALDVSGADFQTSLLLEK